VLSEETLIVLAALGACGLLALGIVELLWPTRVRRAVRRQTLPSPRAARPPRPGPGVRQRREPGPVARPAPSAPSIAPLAPPGSPGAAAQTTAAAIAVPSPAAVAAEPPPAAPRRPEPPQPTAEPSIVEACFALCQEHRHADALDRATAVLTAGSDGQPVDDSQRAALWSVVALARQGLGDDTGARGALEAAIDVAAVADRPTYQRQLAALAERVARRRLAEAERHARTDSEERLAVLREAAAWVERAVTAVPDEPALAQVEATTQALLWPAWERTVMMYVQRQDFRAARRLLREALAEPGFPAARAAAFKELFSGTFSGEIGQLTAQAIRNVQEARESEALAALQRAERMLERLSDDALPATRRQEVDRRLWWGYTRLAARRVEVGDHEAALEPLFHALGYDVGPGRRQETIALLGRALDGVTDARVLAAREMADAGDRETATVQCDALRTLLRRATEQGLTPAELAPTFSRVTRLVESLGPRRLPGPS
jgi:hypothetical protein